MKKRQETNTTAKQNEKEKKQNSLASGEIELDGCAVRVVAWRTQHDVLSKVCRSVPGEHHPCVGLEQLVKWNPIQAVDVLVKSTSEVHDEQSEQIHLCVCLRFVSVFAFALIHLCVCLRFVSVFAFALVFAF
jgi:hypothetical protein